MWNLYPKRWIEYYKWLIILFGGDGLILMLN